MARHAIYALFLVTVVALGVVRPEASVSVDNGPGDVPPEAVRALREGRYLRAGQILRDYLDTSTDTSAAALLLTAQADAGLGDWEQVAASLRGRRWLDTLAGGRGWLLLGRSQLELGRYDASEAAYARYLAVAADGSKREQGLALVRRAIAQTRDGQYDSAVANYRRARVHLPQLEDWLRVFAASAAASAGDTATVETELQETDDELRLAWGWRSRLRARQAADGPRAALAVADAVAGSTSSEALRAEAEARAGELRTEVGDAAGARAAFLRAMAASPGSAHALAAARSLAQSAVLNVADHKAIADVLLRHGRLDGALAAYQRYQSVALVPAEERHEILRATGRALFNAGRYRDAEVRLDAFADSASAPEQAAAARYLAARAKYRDGREPQALATMERIIAQHPNTGAAAEAAFLLADLAHDDGDEERARHFYRQATVLDPTSEAAGLARMRLAGIEYVRKDYEKAAQHYDAYLAAFPTGRRAQQAAYWSALARLRRGDDAEARALLRRVRALNPFSYYSDRAADRLDESLWKVEMEPSPAINPRHETQVAQALARIELLREIGWDEAATFELGRARRHFAQWDGALYSLAEGLNQRGYTSTAIALGWDLYRREGGWNLRLLRVIYPFPYRDIIVAEAEERGVDPFLAAGLIRQESMFNPRARSGAGALGLMQVMPQTGRTLARALRIKRFDTDMLTKPDVNVHLGMRYLADQLRTWNGRVVPVLAAYNAGPTRVQRWRNFPEWGNDDLFAERIPYEETRDYVKIVQHNAAMYRALYGTVVERKERS